MRIGLWHPSDEIATILSKGANHLERAFSDRDIEEAMQDLRLDVVLLELGIKAMPALQVIERVAARGAVNRPIVVIVPATNVGYRQSLMLLRMRLDVRIVLATLGADALLDATASGSVTNRPRCVDRLSTLLAPRLTEASASILLPALTVGCRRSRIGELERASGMPGRTLRARVARLGFPRPSRLLGLVMGCSVAFQCDHDGPKLSVVAQRLGFETADELRIYLVRHTALTPSGWRALGFGGSAQQLGDRLFTGDLAGNLAENVRTAAKGVLVPLEVSDT